MGDPKKQRRKFSMPMHPWQKERIDEETGLIKEYGFKNKKEIWKMDSLLKNFFLQTKRLTAIKTEQSEKEKIQLLNKLKLLGLIPEAANLEDVLGLSLRDVLERRLQSMVFRKGLAKSMKQARQFITHEHIMVGGRKITSPGFLVPKAQEDLITFAPDSGLVDEMHPERIKKKEMPKKPKKKEERKEKKSKKEKIRKGEKEGGKAKK